VSADGARAWLGGRREKEETVAGLRFRDVAHRPLEVLDLTSLTVDEFTALVAPFEGAFQAHMAAWRFDGQPRGARRYTTYATCPLPTAEDRLLFLLVYLKTNPLQIVHGRLFGLPQGKTNQWIHVLLPVLQEALRQQGDTPSRSLDDLAHLCWPLRSSAPGPNRATALCLSASRISSIVTCYVSAKKPRGHPGGRSVPL